MSAGWSDPPVGLTFGNPECEKCGQRHPIGASCPDYSIKVAEPKRTKGVYIGAPACFALELACKQVHDAFANNCVLGNVFIVGSVLERADWRDVDVRLMMDDASFKALFPDAALHSAAWEHDPRWLLMTVAISQWMSAQTGLPVDFQFQPMTFANERHKGARSAAGLRYSSNG